MNRSIRHIAITIFAPMVALALPGCIVQDIHDQIALSNEKLAQIDESFAKVERANELLNNLDAQLDQLAQLEAIQANLSAISTKLGTIDGNLESMDARIASLETELVEVGEHLASLRRTINNIDSTIPFLKISGDGDEGKEALEADPEQTRPSPEPQAPPRPTTGDGAAP